ncbi:hypothetical protein B4U80_07040 [Leptotrombidium deliense]|uniref:Uncharacterized protein n=1 Tax=Leptotrombidium deliense TaxID=299467 RepID=A0A443SNX9_9ACAR|nr:hypothetical protein B4U80_07040 [Leptotrombidium deliense]
MTENVSHRKKQRRASISHGIVRQESFDEPDEQNTLEQTEIGDTDEMDEKSPETMRKQYRELWQLRATFEAEESTANELEANTKNDAKLSKNDSGYKSIERKDYSIDLKTETIFRQFTSSSLSQKSPHQSIQEEQENDVQATYV